MGREQGGGVRESAGFGEISGASKKKEKRVSRRDCAS